MADLPDPSTLTDEELDALLETGQLPEPKSDTDDKKDEKKPDAAEAENKADDESKLEDDGDEPADDDKKEDTEDKPEDEKPGQPGDEDEDKPEDGKPPVETDEKKPSRREQARIRDLLEKYGDPEKPAVSPKAAGMDYEKELDADPAIVKKLEEDRQKASDDSYERGLEQMNSVQFLTRLEIDAPRVEAKYPQLDKNKPDEFKPEAATDVNLLYLRLAGYDPQTKAVKHPEFRYTDFVDTIFGLANDLAETKVEQTVKQVKKQAAQTGLRPDGSKTKTLNLNKAPEDMTDEELDEYLKNAGVPTR